MEVEYRDSDLSGKAGICVNLSLFRKSKVLLVDLGFGVYR
jgi:hypothetical protein